MQSLKNKSKVRGQSSLEFMLIVGALMVIVMYTFPFVSRNAELNKGIAAARDGAQFGATMRGMGFYSSGTSESNKNLPGVIKIDRIEYDITESSDKIENVSISIYVRGPSELKTTSVYATIRSEAQRFVGKAISGDYTTSVSARTGQYYRFQPIQCNSGTWIDT